MPTPRVSVIIPTHNRAGVLAEALDSVFAQKGAGAEFHMDVIVVDDASTDHTPEVIARYPFARHIRLSKGQGPGQARNAGIDESAGEFVAFLDDDDLWLPDKLSRQVTALRAAPGSGLAYSQLLIGGRGGCVFPGRHAPSGALFHHLLLVNLCMMPAVLARREALTGVGGFGDGPLEDYDMWLRMASRDPFLFVPGIVAVYRQSTEGVYQTAVRSGEYGTALLRIVSNALATLPPSETSEPIKREARANVELRIAVPLSALHLTTRAWQHLRAALEIDAGIMLNPGNCQSIGSILGDYAATFPSPLAAATRLWKELLSALDGRPIEKRRDLKRLLADAYWEVAVAQRRGIGCPTSMGGAALAAARSIAVHPLDLRKWWSVVRWVGRPSRWAMPVRREAERPGRRAGPMPGYTSGESSTPVPSSRR